MKLKQVQIQKLFGYFDYSIEFYDTVTIIHGPNGCGKTTMLRIIDATFNKQLETLKTTDFKSVQYVFSDDTTLKIERKKVCLDEANKEAGNFIYLAYTINENGESHVFDSFENSDDYITTIQKFLKGYRPLHWLERFSDDTWYDRRSDKKLTTEEVVTRYGTMIYKRYGREFFEEEIPDEVQNMLNTIDVRLIAADRLTVPKRVERQYGEDNIKIERRVDIIAADLSKKIRDAIQQYAQLAQAKDRTFPFRAIKQDTLMSVEEIKTKMIELEAKRKEFIETGILEEEKDDIDIHELVDAITDNDRQNLSLYGIYSRKPCAYQSGACFFIVVKCVCKAIFFRVKMYGEGTLSVIHFNVFFALSCWGQIICYRITWLWLAVAHCCAIHSIAAGCKQSCQHCSNKNDPNYFSIGCFASFSFFKFYNIRNSQNYTVINCAESSEKIFRVHFHPSFSMASSKVFLVRRRMVFTVFSLTAKACDISFVVKTYQYLAVKILRSLSGKLNRNLFRKVISSFASTSRCKSSPAGIQSASSSMHRFTSFPPRFRAALCRKREMDMCLQILPR